MKKQIFPFLLLLISWFNFAPVHGGYFTGNCPGILTERLYTPIMIGALDGLLGCKSKLSWCHFIARMTVPLQEAIDLSSQPGGRREHLVKAQRAQRVVEDADLMSLTAAVVLVPLQYSLGSTIGKELRSFPGKLREFLNRPTELDAQKSLKAQRNKY